MAEGGRRRSDQLWDDFEDGESGDGRPNDRIIGAIFENVSKSMDPQQQQGSCRLVVAFRGTMIGSWESMPADMAANASLALHQLHTTRRFAVALHAIRAAVEAVSTCFEILNSWSDSAGPV
jgi:hypothetical protein